VAKGSSVNAELPFSAPKKSVTFLHASKNATFFVKTGFHEKSRYARQKARTGRF
jgi:hypothetical protein